MRTLAQDLQRVRNLRGVAPARAAGAIVERGPAAGSSGQGAVIWRPSIAAGLAGVGPGRLSGAFLRGIPGLMQQFAEIPGEYWTQGLNADGVTQAVIACPCGRDARVEVGRWAPCDESEGGCPRWFMYMHPRVYVAFSPQQRAETQPAPDAEPSVAE